MHESLNALSLAEQELGLMALDHSFGNAMILAENLDTYNGVPRIVKSSSKKRENAKGMSAAPIGRRIRHGDVRAINDEHRSAIPLP